MAGQLGAEELAEELGGGLPGDQDRADVVTENGSRSQGRQLACHASDGGFHLGFRRQVLDSALMERDEVLQPHSVGRPGDRPRMEDGE